MANAEEEWMSLKTRIEAIDRAIHTLKNEREHLRQQYVGAFEQMKQEALKRQVAEEDQYSRKGH